jgi:hypothetical protein
MHLHRLILAVALGSAAACSSNGITDSNRVAAELRGTWTQTGLGAGSSRVLTLQVTGTTVTGTGSYSGEAGPFGNLTVTGSITGTTITLTIAQDDDVTYHLNATLASPNELTGSLFTTGDPVEVSFQKIQVDPV